MEVAESGWLTDGMDTVSRQVIVDGANVVGSRPDGWWRDRSGAASRLAHRLASALSSRPGEIAGLGGGDGGDTPMVHLVLEGQGARAVDLPQQDGLQIVLAETDGDSTIVEVAERLRDDSPDDVDVVVVTADRGLRDRVEAVGARSVGPGSLLTILDD